MRIGYARVSRPEQSLDLQFDALYQAGCQQVFSDQMTGAASKRPGLEAALSHLRDGDELIVWKLDRLGRTARKLIDLVADLEEKHIHFRSLTDGIDTSTSTGRFFFRVMAALAEMERELLIERTQAGLAAARARGRVGGRPVKMLPHKLEAAKKLIAQGLPVTDVAKAIGVSAPTLYRWLPDDHV